MVENDGSNDRQLHEGKIGAISDSLGVGQSKKRKSGLSQGVHGNVTGDSDVDFDLTDCEIVAQSFDDVAGAGTRLYHVDNNIYALSQFRRAVSQDWTETLQTHGRLTVDPVELEREPLNRAIEDHDADSLENFSYVQLVYADTCEQMIWHHLKAGGTEGLIPRGRIACVEDHNWRSTLRPALAEQLTHSQTDAVLDGLMAARPNTNWTWCQLYGVYVAALRFGASTSKEGNAT